jgi:aminoglycoside 6-adenylyltransferase
MSEVPAFLDRVAEWAVSRDDVRAVLLVGSVARTDQPADEWSDVDLILAVDDPAPFLAGTDWLAPFGRVLVSMVEATAVGGEQERRVLFASGLDVDFSVVAADLVGLLPELAEDPGVRTAIGRGVRVLHDELGIGEDVLAIRPPDPDDDAPSAAGLDQQSAEFWYGVVWAAKKLRRGEVVVAKAACDGKLLRNLVEVLRLKTRLRHPERDTWHGLRFAERWLDPDDAALLAGTAATADADGVATALRALVEAFAAVEADVADALGAAPSPADDLRALVESILSTDG